MIIFILSTVFLRLCLILFPSTIAPFDLMLPNFHRFSMPSSLFLLGPVLRVVCLRPVLDPISTGTIPSESFFPRNEIEISLPSFSIGRNFPMSHFSFLWRICTSIGDFLKFPPHRPGTGQHFVASFTSFPDPIFPLFGSVPANEKKWFPQFSAFNRRPPS